MFRASQVSFALLSRPPASAVHRAWVGKEAAAATAVLVAELRRNDDSDLCCPLCGKTGADVIACCGPLFAEAA